MLLQNAVFRLCTFPDVPKMNRCLLFFLLLLAVRSAFASPPNDRCGNALPVTVGIYEGETCTATRDGSASCVSNSSAGDVWYQYTATVNETITATTFGSNYDTVLSVHSGCPGDASNEIACSDDCGNPGACVTFQAIAGNPYWIRVAGFQNSAGRFQLSISRDSSIAGHVTDSSTGQAIKDVQVLVYLKQSLEFVKTASTDASGNYIISGLSPGDYIVRTQNNFAYVDELYDNHYCEGVTCNPFVATVVTIKNGEFHSGVDFGLDQGGRISGTVTDSATGLPLQNVEVHVHDLSNNHITLGFTDASGSYTSFDGLPAGNYAVFALNHARYVDEVYNNVPCPGGGCSIGAASNVSVNLGTVTPINFSLDPGGLITGVVSDASTGNPINGVQVIVYDSTGRRVTTASSDATGSYRVFDGLPTGNYFVRTSNSFSFVDELYPDIPCVAGFCQVTGGSTVPVTVGAESQLDFQLNQGAMISGKVTNSATSLPLQGILLDILDSANNHLGFEFTDADGNFSTRVGLTSGNYFIKSLNQTGYVDEIYNNIPCIASQCNASQGTPIPLNPGDHTTDVNFNLDPGGTISGKVTEASTGLPLNNVYVFLATNQGSIIAYGLSNSCGNYTTFHGVPEDDYIFRTLNPYGLLDEAYDDHLCIDNICSVDTADRVHVVPGTHGINFSLSEQILLRDEFDDGVLDWLTSGGPWVESNGELSVTAGPKKAIAMAVLPWNPSGADGCKGCTILLRMKTSAAKTSVRAWYMKKNNHVDLEINSTKGSWRLKQISGGKAVARSKGRKNIAPDTYSDLKMIYDGRKISVSVDGEHLMNLNVVGTISGDVGFTVQDGSASFDQIVIY